jgi:hypothetical protein
MLFPEIRKVIGCLDIFLAGMSTLTRFGRGAIAAPNALSDFEGKPRYIKIAHAPARDNALQNT